MFILKMACEPNVSEECMLEFEQNGSVNLTVRSLRFGVMNFTDVDLFGALVKFRLRLEENGYVLLCNGARKDAYPSRMAREIGGGAESVCS